VTMRELAYAILLAWASYRAWRLIAVDTITKSLRERLFTEARRDKHLYEYARLWLSCPWCAGTWITAVFTFATDRLVDGGIPAPLLIFAAAAAGCGMLGGHDPDYQAQQMAGE
jgi:hypothetical protein